MPVAPNHNAVATKMNALLFTIACHPSENMTPIRRTSGVSLMSFRVFENIKWSASGVVGQWRTTSVHFPKSAFTNDNSQESHEVRVRTYVTGPSMPTVAVKMAVRVAF